MTALHNWASQSSPGSSSNRLTLVTSGKSRHQVFPLPAVAAMPFSVFLAVAVDKATLLVYRATHGDWLCWSATELFGSGAFIQTHMSKLRKGG
jgi:hypothetical protein